MFKTMPENSNELYLFYLRWNKFHCYNIGRSSGTFYFHLANAGGMTDIVAQGFNLGR